VKPCDQHIVYTIALAREMIRLADQGDADREDTGCGILYGILRDSAYKIWRLAEEEKKRHQAKGWWPEPCPLPEDIDGHCFLRENQKSSEEKEEKP
jgi:hypothetical protein